MVSTKANAINASTTVTSGVVAYNGTSLVTTGALINSSNIYTNSYQPSFGAYVGTTTAALTGDGTNVTVPFGTKSWDNNNNYSTSTYSFGTPIAGTYLFTATIAMQGFNGTETSFQFTFNVSGSSVYLNEWLPKADVNGQMTLSASALMYLASGNNVKVGVVFSGSATKSVEFIAGSGVSYFTGCLIT